MPTATYQEQNREQPQRGQPHMAPSIITSPAVRMMLVARMIMAKPERNQTVDAADGQSADHEVDELRGAQRTHVARTLLAAARPSRPLRAGSEVSASAFLVRVGRFGPSFSFGHHSAASIREGQAFRVGLPP